MRGHIGGKGRATARSSELERLVDLSLDMLCVATMSGRFLVVNPAWCLTLGYDEDELIGRCSCFELVHPDDRERTLAEASRLTVPGVEVVNFENRFLHRDGSHRWLVWSARSDGERLYAVARDVTDSREAHDALRHSEERMRTVVRTTHEGIWTLDASDRTSFVNARMAEMLGYTVEEMLGRPVYDFLDEEGAAQAQARMARRRTGGSDQHELKYLRKDGRELWVILSATPLQDTDGTYLGAFAMVTDITERIRQEHAVRASEERYRNIIETTSEGVWMIDRDHRTTFANQRMAQMLGYTVEEMLGKPVSEFQPADDRSAPRLSTSGPREVRYLRKDGSEMWGLLSGSPLTDGDGEYGGALAMIADITERKRSEEAVARLATIVASSPDAIFSTDLEGTITSWNAAAERIYGYSEEEMIGRSGWLITLPARREEALELGRRMLSGEAVVDFFSKGMTKDGRTIDVAPSVSPIYSADDEVVGTLAIVRPVSPPQSSGER